MRSQFVDDSINFLRLGFRERQFWTADFSRVGGSDLHQIWGRDNAIIDAPKG